MVNTILQGAVKGTRRRGIHTKDREERTRQEKSWGCGKQSRLRRIAEMSFVVPRRPSR